MEIDQCKLLCEFKTGRRIYKYFHELDTLVSYILYYTIVVRDGRCDFFFYSPTAAIERFVNVPKTYNILVVSEISTILYV